METTKLISNFYLIWIEKWNAFFPTLPKLCYGTEVQDSLIHLRVGLMRFCSGRCRIWAPLISLEPESFSFSAKASESRAFFPCLTENLTEAGKLLPVAISMALLDFFRS